MTTFAQSLMFLLSLSACTSKPCVPIQKVVKEVGGCNKHGECSALLEDGTQVHDVYQPVKGGKVDIKRCGRL